MAEDTFSLIRQAQAGDESALNRLVEENGGLVWSIARRFFGRGVEPDDLFQLGCVGLLKAIQGFSLEFGTQFSTYAVPKISGEIRRFLRDDGAVKVSRSVKERAMQIWSAKNALEQRLGREPTVSEISAETGFSVEDIALAETATAETRSIQAESGEDNFTLECVLGETGGEETLLERIALDTALEQLSERERMVISLRFFHGLTQDRTARILGVSQVQVSRLERKALSRLRVILEPVEA